MMMNKMVSVALVQHALQSVVEFVLGNLPVEILVELPFEFLLEFHFRVREATTAQFVSVLCRNMSGHLFKHFIELFLLKDARLVFIEPVEHFIAKLRCCAWLCII